MAFTAVAAIGVASSAYSANRSRQQGRRMGNLAEQQAGRQEYYSQQLIELMRNPGSVFDDPGYLASFGQGTQAVERSLASRGLLGSGNAAIELQQFGQSFAHDYFRQQQQLLASLSGAQFNPAAAGAAAQGSYDSSFDQLGASLSTLGYMFGGLGGAGFGGRGAAAETGWGGPTSVPGTMEAGGGYIYNIPGRGP